MSKLIVNIRQLSFILHLAIVLRAP